MIAIELAPQEWRLVVSALRTDAATMDEMKANKRRANNARRLADQIERGLARAPAPKEALP